MHIAKLSYFMVLAEEGSFSRAAEFLYISQSSLSKSISNLEKELGVVLLDRGTKNLELTPAGKLTFEYAEHATREYNRLLLSLRKYVEGGKEALSLGALPLTSEYAVSSVLTDFWSENKHIQIDFIERSQKDLIDKLDYGLISIAIARTDYVDQGKYNVRPLITDRLAVVCSEEHRFAELETISLKNLAKESLILLEQGSDISKLFIDSCLNVGVRPFVPFRLSRHTPLLEAVSKNFGVSALPSKLIERSSVDHLKMIPLEEEIMTHVGLIYDKRSCMTRVCEDLVTYFTERYKDEAE